MASSWSGSPKQRWNQGVRAMACESDSRRDGGHVHALDTWMPVQTHEGGIHETGVHL
jgi:hypothetical protein